jgi:hypothetical protein
MENVGLLVLGFIVLAVAIGMAVSRKQSDAAFAFQQSQQRSDADRQNREFRQRFPEGMKPAILEELEVAKNASQKGDIEKESSETTRVYESFTSQLAEFPAIAIHVENRYLIGQAIHEYRDGVNLCAGSEIIMDAEINSDDTSYLQLWSDRVIVNFASYRLSAETRAEVFSDGSKRVNYTTAAGPGEKLLDALSNPEINRHLDDDRSFVLKISDPDWQVTVKCQMDDEYSAYNPDESDLDELRSFAARLNAHVKKKYKQAQKKPESKPKASAAEQLVELSKLLDRGLITSQQFEKLKDDII